MAVKSSFYARLLFLGKVWYWWTTPRTTPKNQSNSVECWVKILIYGFPSLLSRSKSNTGQWTPKAVYSSFIFWLSSVALLCNETTIFTRLLFPVCKWEKGKEKKTHPDDGYNESQVIFCSHFNKSRCHYTHQQLVITRKPSTPESRVCNCKGTKQK